MDITGINSTPPKNPDHYPYISLDLKGEHVIVHVLINNTTRSSSLLMQKSQTTTISLGHERTRSKLSLTVFFPLELFLGSTTIKLFPLMSTTSQRARNGHFNFRFLPLLSLGISTKTLSPTLYCTNEDRSSY